MKGGLKKAASLRPIRMDLGAFSGLNDQGYQWETVT